MGVASIAFTIELAPSDGELDRAPADVERPGQAEETSQSWGVTFTIEEVALLDNADRAVLTSTAVRSFPHGLTPDEFWSWLTREELAQMARTAISAAYDGSETGRYRANVRSLRDLGHAVSEEALRALPCEVVLGRRLEARLGAVT